MPFDGNGNFVRVHNWTSDAANGIDINAGEMDAEDNGFASGLSNTVTRDGQGKMSVDFLPNADNVLNLGSSGVRWATINGTPISSLPITQANIGLIFQPKTSAETTAGVTPINYFRPPMDVDRYIVGGNSIPGTTDCTVGWNAAVAVAMVAGGVVTYGYTKLYLVTGPINCAFSGGGGVPGIVIQSLGIATHDNLAGIKAQHTGVAVFDCTGNDSITFRDVSIKTDTTTFPKTGILTARNNLNGSLLIRLDNVKIAGKFSVANYYNYGSEDDVLIGCYFSNAATGGNTKTRIYTSNNISSLTSPFVTIATGNQSCIDHNSFGCQDLNSAGGATTDCIYLDAVDSFKSYGGWAACAGGGVNGRAIVYVETINGASNFCTIDGLSAENQGSFNQACVVQFANSAAATPTGWSITNLRGISATNAIASGALIILDSFHIRNISELVSHGINVAGTLQNSVVESPNTALTIGTSKNNFLVGDTSSFSITTRSHDNWQETGTTNRTFSPGIIATGTANGFTTVSLTQVGTFTYNNNMVTFSILLNPSTSVAWASNATIPTLPGVAIAQGSCTVVDQNTGTVQGGGTISGGGGHSTITLPNAQTTSAHVFLITGTYFVA